jgi:hypothetical protein
MGQESPVVEPVYPFQRRELDGFERAPSCSSMDELGLIEALIVSARALS